jgi:hypothetical protein
VSQRLTRRAGDTWTLTFTGLGVLTSRTKLYWVLKDDVSKADAASLVEIEEVAGLMILNGAASTAGNGTIVVTNQTTDATAVVTLKPAASVLVLPGTSFQYALKVIIAGVATTLAADAFTVDPGVVLAVS